jgi:hypothetical protein
VAGASKKRPFFGHFVEGNMHDFDDQKCLPDEAFIEPEWMAGVADLMRDGLGRSSRRYQRVYSLTDQHLWKPGGFRPPSGLRFEAYEDARA